MGGLWEVDTHVSFGRSDMLIEMPECKQLCKIC